MAKSLCRFLLQVKHALVAIFNVAKMSFKAISENKFLAKISKFTVNDQTNQSFADRPEKQAGRSMRTRYKYNVSREFHN